MPRSTPRLLPAAALLGLTLAACSGGSQPETAPAAPQTPTATTAPTAPPASKPVVQSWAGTWSRREAFNPGTLTITRRPADTDGFNFELEALSGAHTGELSGRAKLQKAQARYLAADADAGPCELVFRLTDDSTLTVEQPQGSCGAGAGVSFAGKYRRGTGRKAAAHETTLLSLGVFRSPAEDAAFRRLVGADYRLFTESAQLVSEESTPEFPGAVVYESFVRGLGGIMGNIVIIDPQQRIWAAVIAGDSVLYYTNQPDAAARLPDAIRQWSGAAAQENRVIDYKSKPN